MNWIIIADNAVKAFKWVAKNVSKKDFDNFLDSQFDGSKLSIADLCNKKSASIDNYIVEIEKKENVVYAAGTFSIIKDGESRFYLITDLYFKKPDSKFINKKIKSGLLECYEELNYEAISELDKVGNLTFDVHHENK